MTQIKRYLNLFDFRQKVNYLTEVLSGLTVALALVPEAVAFAFMADLNPLTGLYAAFSIGQKWDSAVLLDSDSAGIAAKKKIDELYSFL